MFFYTIALFFSGYSGIIFQVIFLRELLTIFYGNELCVGTILGLWLLGVASGAAVGAVTVDKSSRSVEKKFLVSFLLLHILFPAALYLMRSTVFLFIQNRGEYLSFFKLILMVVLFVVPVSFQIGYVFPLGCKLSNLGRKTGARSGWLYFCESTGALVGGVIFSFLLVNKFDGFQIAFFNLFVASLIIVLNSRRGYKWIFFSVLCLIFLLFDPSDINHQSLQNRWNSLFSPLSLEHSVDTKYQNISISRQNDQIDVYRNLKYDFSIPDSYSNEIFVNFSLCETINPQNILLIEGYFSGLIPHILAHNVKKIDVVEIDETFFQTVRRFVPEGGLKTIDDEKVKVHFADGRFFVKNCAEKYDAVFVNLPDPSTAMLNRFYTQDFFREISGILSDDGIIVFRLTSTPNYLGEDMVRYNTSVYKTFKAVFSDVLVTYGDKKIFLGCNKKGVLTQNCDRLIERFRKRDVNAQHFVPEIFESFLDKKRIAFVRKKFEEESANVAVNSDDNPIAYHYNLYLWDEFSGSRLTPLIRTVEKISPVKFGLLLLFLLGGWICFQKRKINNKNTVLKSTLIWAIFSTGFTAMGIEILLLFSFQSIFGYLYSVIGLIIGFFMFGLMLGSIFSIIIINRVTEVLSVLKTLVIIELCILCFSFFVPCCIDWIRDMQSQRIVIIFVLVGVAGFLTGSEFPLAIRLFAFGCDDFGFSGGIIDCSDHAGACLGAVVVGTFFLPLLGAGNTAVLIGMMNIVSFFMVVYATKLFWRK